MKPSLYLLALVLITTGCQAASASPPPPAASTVASASPSAAVASATPGANATPTAAIATATPAVAPSPSRVESDTFFSAALGQTMPYFIYLPSGYDSSPTTRYPVLYMLHGAGGSNTEWEGYGLFGTADELIGSGAIAPLIIVLPQGDQSFWMDHANGGPKWGTYTAHDVVGEIDGHFRTLADRAHRAIGGLSMGADGAMQLAMNNPTEFSVVGAHSPTLRPYAQWPSFFGDQAYADAHDPAYLFRTMPDVGRSLVLEADIGTQDTLWRPSAEAFHQQLLGEGIPHQWHDQWVGGHDGSYWSAHTPDYLRFYDAGFKAQTTPAG